MGPVRERSRSRRRKRPWLAAFLGAAVAGAGHRYLRRWLRALGWLAVATLTSYLFVPASALDAYQLAIVNNYLLRSRSQHDADPTVCPSCDRPVDDDLDFCHWCTAPLAETTDG